jgi:AP2 domain
MKARDKFYITACNAFARCYKPNHKYYSLYGGRGIRVEFDSIVEFADYLQELPGYEPGKSLDRVDNDGNYEPGNLRWATKYEQEANKGIRKDNTSGIKYLGRMSSRKCWRVKFVREGRESCKTFSDSKFGGTEEAKQAAIAYLEELLKMCQI